VITEEFPGIWACGDVFKYPPSLPGGEKVATIADLFSNASKHLDSN
jgi:hypothetical protein